MSPMAKKPAKRFILWLDLGSAKRRKMNPPVNHPLTRSQGPLPPAAAAETSQHTDLGRPGRLAPRLIDDLLGGQFPGGGALAALSVGCRHDFPKDSNKQGLARHELLSIGHQCVLDERVPLPEGSVDVRSILSCICSQCRYHFVFTVTRPGASLPCGPKNNPDYFHHLVEISSETTQTQDKYFPLVASASFTCSASSCDARVKIEVSSPRLEDRFLAYLQDDDRVLRQLRDAQEAEPGRYDDAAQYTPDAVSLLRRYIKNIVDKAAEVPPKGGPEQRIDKRNRRFYIQFGDGPECVELFQHLEFTEVLYGKNNSEMWRVPVVEAVRPTPIGSRLAFFQDVLSELETVLTARQASSTGLVLSPQPALNMIKDSLGIPAHYATTKFLAYDASDFEVLGVPADLHESMLWHAFLCQSQTDPANRAKYFQCLTRVAIGRNHEDLNLKIATEESLMMAGPRAGIPLGAASDDEALEQAKKMSMQDQAGDLAVACRYFDFDKIPSVSDIPVLIGRFRVRLESSPRQKSAHREKLLIIFRAMANRHPRGAAQAGDEIKQLKEIACEAMSLSEAYAYLQVQPSEVDETISSIALWSAQTAGERDPLLVAVAVQIITQARNSSTLRHTASVIAASIRENYDDNRGGNGWLEEAPVNMDVPAGLENIRNTCYLNSILQYLYTVKTVREIVLDWERYGLENTEEKLKARRIDPGSTRVERGEAYAGHQFALKLGALFDELRTTTSRAVKPPQSLALVALKNSNQLEDDGLKLLKKEASQKNRDKGLPAAPPPLPVRSSPAPPVPPRPSQGPNVTVNAITDPEAAETSSTVSSQTLVNQADDGSDPGYVSVTKPPGTAVNGLAAGQSKETAIDIDTDMVDLVGTGDNEPGHKGEGDAGEGSSKVDGSGDTIMTDAAAAEPAVTVEQKIAKALNDESTVGTDQQDVEEVMGNIIGHLRSSIKATGEDRDLDVQLDPVMDLFFWISATYSRKNGEAEFRRIERTPNRWVTAYPDENGQVITLLQALDRNFQRELIQEGEDRYERFSSIVRLPPILHIHIQRSTKGQGKNNTAIAIPEVLCLDRFLDAEEGSALFQKRMRSWNVSERLRSLDGADGADGEAVKMTEEQLFTEALALYDGGGGTDAQTRQNEDLEEVDGFTLIASGVLALAGQQDVSLPPASDVEMDARDVAIKNGAHPDGEGGAVQWERVKAAFREELDGMFAEDHNEAYRLHAVICHAGSTGRSGHYWVWIFDFEKRVWRKYNDSSVTEEADADKVLAQLSAAGEPYYLAYVRADQIQQMVNIPVREEAVLEETATQNACDQV